MVRALTPARHAAAADRRSHLSHLVLGGINIAAIEKGLMAATRRVVLTLLVLLVPPPATHVGAARGLQGEVQEAAVEDPDCPLCFITTGPPAHGTVTCLLAKNGNVKGLVLGEGSPTLCGTTFAKADKVEFTGAITSVALIAAKTRVRRPTRISVVQFNTSDGRSYQCGKGINRGRTRGFKMR